MLLASLPSVSLITPQISSGRLYFILSCAACRAAALTLRHLAERDAGALLPARMEGSLFRALDAETDGEIAEQLRATLRTLLRNGVPCETSYWLEVRAPRSLLFIPRLLLCCGGNLPLKASTAGNIRNCSPPIHARLGGSDGTSTVLQRMTL